MRKENSINIVGVICFLLLPILSHAQIDRKVVMPLDIARQNVVGIAATNNNLYKATTVRRSDNQIVLTLSKNNGFTWQPLSSILLNDKAEIAGIHSHNGNIFIYGRFSYSISPQPTVLHNILEFNEQWIYNSIYSGFEERDIVNTMATLGDSLIVAGSFDSIGSSLVNNISMLFKHEFLPIKDQSNVIGCNNRVLHLEVDNGEIYASGAFTKAGSTEAKAMAKFNFSNWTMLTIGHNIIPNFTIYKNQIYFRSNQSLHEIRRLNRANSVESVAAAGIDSIFRLNKLFVFKNQLMAIGDFKTTTKIRSGWLSFNDVFWSTVNASKTCLHSASNNRELFMYGIQLLGPYSQVKNAYIGSYLPARKLIFGHLYFDFNKSCKLDSGDLPITKTAMLFGTDKFAVFTNDKGIFYYYFNKVEDKTPRVLLANDLFNYDLCIPDSNNLKNITSELIGPMQVGVQPELIRKARLETRAIVHNGRWLRQNGRALVTYFIRNVGFEEATQTTIKLGGKSKLDKFISLPNAEEKDTFYQWNIGTVQPFEIKAITISFALPDQLDVLNNTVNFQLEYEYNNSQELEAGNDFFDQQVTSEDLIVSKEQSLHNNAPLVNNAIAATDTIIEYQINFQNRTNSIIQDLVVIDTVDLTYDLLYTRTISSSHDFVERIEQDPYNPDIGYIIYTFPNINLSPNAQANPEITNDKGYVRLAFVFSKQHEMNDEVKNTATVIMDDDISYSTNTVLAKVDRMVSTTPIANSIEGNFYPNPFESKIYFNQHSGSELPYKVYTYQGVLVKQGISTDNQIDLQMLSNGLYIIQIETSEGLMTGKCLKK